MVALITDMDQPLGMYIGNALEIVECVEVLQGRGPSDLRDLSVELAAWMFYLGEKTPSIEAGRKLAQQTIGDGSAFEKFCEVARLQGGDPEALRDTRKLPRARHERDIRSKHDGYVQAMDCEQVGIASLVLGGGREKKEDAIDPAVGIVLHKKVGDQVNEGEPLCTLHFNADARLAEAESLIYSSYRIGSAAAKPGKLIRRVIGGEMEISEARESRQAR
jgi:pyrimidine-nucleoside phosphorylase